MGFMFLQDWFLSKEYSGHMLPVGAGIMAYLVYVAIEAGNIAVMNYVHPTSIVKVLLSPIKIALGYYLFWRIYSWIKS